MAVDRSCLRCPCEKKSSLSANAEGFVCAHSPCPHGHPAGGFISVGGVPILVSPLTCDTAFENWRPTLPRRTKVSRLRFLKKNSRSSATTKENLDAFVESLLNRSDNPKILVFGAGEPNKALEPLYLHPRLTVHNTDVFYSPNVDLVCDAHYLPLSDESYDGVVIVAVLEHVVDPARVVSEIFRVLKTGALVYAETPFMQQVHEGAYDFTRFSVLGHRYLFRRFEALKFGGVGGAEIVFEWSVRYLVWAVTRSRFAGRFLGTFAGLLVKPLSRAVSDASLHDSSSGVFFLGSKDPKHSITHRDIVSLYRGLFTS